MASPARLPDPFQSRPMLEIATTFIFSFISYSFTTTYDNKQQLYSIRSHLDLMEWLPRDFRYRKWQGSKQALRQQYDQHPIRSVPAHPK